MAFKINWKKYALSGADQRQKMARQVDFWGFVLLIWLLTLFWLYPIQWFWLLLIVGLEGLGLWFGHKHWGSWQSRQSRQRQLLKLAKEQIQILGTETNFWQDLWLKLGCRNFQPFKADAAENLDLKIWQGEINGVKLLLAASRENPVQEETADIFLRLVTDSGLEGGVLMAAGQFSPAALQKALYFDRHYLLRFWDLNYLAELVVQTGLELKTTPKPGKVPRFRPLPRREYLWAAGVMLLMLWFPLPSYLKYAYGAFALINLAIYAYARYIHFVSELENPWESIGSKESEN